MAPSPQFGPPAEWPPRARFAAWVSLALLVAEGVALYVGLSGVGRLMIGVALLVSACFWIGQLFKRHPSETGDQADPS